MLKNRDILVKAITKANKITENIERQNRYIFKMVDRKIQ